MPCPCYAPTMPFFSRSRHRTSVERRPVGYCPFSASSGYHAEIHEVVIRRIPISDEGGQCETKHRLSWTRKRVVAAHYKKGRSVKLFGYFRLPCGLSRRTRYCRSRAGAGHGMCELTHGMAGKGQGRGMLCGIGPYRTKSYSVPVTGPVVVQRVGRGTALLFHDRGTSRK